MSLTKGKGGGKNYAPAGEGAGSLLFYLGDKMKIDFLYQQLFFCMYNAIYMDHVDCCFLYETLRSKLNLFIQISLNAPPIKKPGSTYLHSLGENCFRVYMYSYGLHAGSLN